MVIVFDFMNVKSVGLTSINLLYYITKLEVDHLDVRCIRIFFYKFYYLMNTFFRN